MENTQDYIAELRAILELERLMHLYECLHFILYACVLT